MATHKNNNQLTSDKINLAKYYELFSLIDLTEEIRRSMDNETIFEYNRDLEDFGMTSQWDVMISLV